MFRGLYKAINLFWIIEITGLLVCEIVWSSTPIVEEYYTPTPHIESIPLKVDDEPIPMSMHQIDHAAESFEMKQKEIIDTMPLESTTSIQDDSLTIMAKVVHAEAGNQDDLGKRLVVDVLLNRVDSPLFPNSVEEVATQKDQFNIASTYTHADMRAVKDELNNRTDAKVLWFRTDKFHTYGIPAYQCGDHYFSMLEE